MLGDRHGTEARLPVIEVFRTESKEVLLAMGDRLAENHRMSAVAENPSKTFANSILENSSRLHE